MSKVVLQCEGLSRVYEDGDRSVTVLRGVDLDAASGEKIAVVGGSGSGKSTLLNLLGGLDNPSSGRVLMNGKDLSKLDERAYASCVIRNWVLFISFIICCRNLMREKMSPCLY